MRIPTLLRSERLTALAAGLIAFVVYFWTSAPSITWQHNGADGADFVTAAFTLGIPHPPGYPLFTLLGSLFAYLPFLEPAAGVGILSALAGALAVFALARAGAALGASRLDGGLAAPLAAILALGFAFAPAVWSQATLALPYTLNLLFACIILWAMVTDDPRRIYWAAAAFGFGAANHPAILLFAPGALWALRPARADKVGRAALLFVAPLALYAYLPLRALFNPAVNWGDPRTPEGFLWVVTGGPYLAVFGSTDIAARMLSAAGLAVAQFTPLGLLLGAWGVLRLALAGPRIATAFELNAALVGGYALAFAARDAPMYWLPALAVGALWIMYGAADLAARIPRRAGAAAALLVLAALPLYNLTWFAAMDLSADYTALDYGRAIFEGLPHDVVIFAEGDDRYFALDYYRHVILQGSSSAVVVSQGLLQYAWYYNNLARALYEVTFAPADVETDSHLRAVEVVSVTFAEGRLVCFTRSSPLLPEFEYETRGELKCVVAQK